MTPQTSPWTKSEQQQYTTTYQPVPAPSGFPDWGKWIIGLLTCVALGMLAQWAMKEMAINKAVDTVKDKFSDLTSYIQAPRRPFVDSTF